jgi:hypothetical protein
MAVTGKPDQTCGPLTEGAPMIARTFDGGVLLSDPKIMPSLFTRAARHDGVRPLGKGKAEATEDSTPVR